MDNGYYDMYKIMKALRDVNYDGIVIPDHIPQMAGASEAGWHTASPTCAPCATARTAKRRPDGEAPSLISARWPTRPSP